MPLKPLRKRLEEVSKKMNLRLDVIQQDYILSWILDGLFEHHFLKNRLIFKGGTALKKCYFGEYRFSEDLDFTAHNRLPKGDLLLRAIREACEKVEHKLNEYAPMLLSVEEYKEKEPHPSQQDAYKIRAQFPWQREPLTMVMIEISRDENLLFPPVAKRILHSYGEPIDASIMCYSLEEIVLEKLRAILQHTKKLHERDWSRSRVRDYYDLWRIFGAFEHKLSFSNFSSDLQKKCYSKEVSFADVSSFFDIGMMNHVEKTWERWLGPLVSDLPDHTTVVDELRVKLKMLFENKDLIRL